MGAINIDALTLEEYLAVTRDEQGPGLVRPTIGENVRFEIKDQFMRELRAKLFSGNDDEDAFEHIEHVLYITSLFNIPGVSNDAILLRVFPMTLSGGARRWVDRLPGGTINTWDLLKNKFVQRYCPPAITARKLAEIYNFKQKDDETLYQAWDRYNYLFYKYPNHDLNKQQKVSLFYKGMNIATKQILDSRGPIPGETPVRAIDSIQDLASHSLKWHDEGNHGHTEENIEGMNALTNKFGNLGREIKKIKENIHSLQINREACKGVHRTQKCPLKEEVKRVEGVKYGNVNKPFHGFGGNGAKYRVGPQGYYTKIEDKAPKVTSLEDLVDEHIKESTRRNNMFKEWMMKIKEDTDRNLRNQEAAIKNLNVQIGQLVNDFDANEINAEICKAVFAKAEQEEEELQSTNQTDELCGINFLQQDECKAQEEALPCQLPIKEPNPGDFLLPCTIGNFKILVAADLGASINLMSFSLFKELNLTDMKGTNMILEMADTSKSRPRGTVENVLIRTGQLLFPADFVIIDMDHRQHNNLILGRPFLATSHAHIKVFEKQISLEAGGNRINFELKDPFKFQTESSSNPCTNPSPEMQFCGKNDSNLSGDKNVDSKQEQVNQEINPASDGSLEGGT